MLRSFSRLFLRPDLLRVRASNFPSSSSCNLLHNHTFLLTFYANSAEALLKHGAHHIPRADGSTPLYVAAQQVNTRIRAHTEQVFLSCVLERGEEGGGLENTRHTQQSNTLTRLVSEHTFKQTLTYLCCVGSHRVGGVAD